MGDPWDDPHTSLRTLQSLAVAAWLHLALCNLVEGRQISLEMQISLFWDGLCQVGREGVWQGQWNCPWIWDRLRGFLSFSACLA